MRSWPALRALLLGAAIAVGLIDGCPVPSENNLQRWPQALVPFGKRLRATRAWLLTPFGWIGHGLAVHQRWSLFSSADQHRFLMWIEGRQAGGSWKVLFRPHDPEHRYQADVIEYRRLRGAWNIYRRGPSPGYPAFVDWISRAVFSDPTLNFDEVRVRMQPIDVTRPASHAAPEEFQHEQVRERSQASKVPAR